MKRDKGQYCEKMGTKVGEKEDQIGIKRENKKKHVKISHISDKVHDRKDQGMIKYGTSPEEVHPEAQK